MTLPLRALARAWVERVQALLGPSPLPTYRIMEEFREAGAITPRTAQPFHAHSRVEEQAFLQLLEAGVIRQPVRGRYYLDERSLPRRLPMLGLLRRR